MNAVSGDFTPASRAMLVGAMLGGVASGASHIQAKKSGLETNDDFLSKDRYVQLSLGERPIE